MLHLSCLKNPILWSSHASSLLCTEEGFTTQQHTPLNPPALETPGEIVHLVPHTSRHVGGSGLLRTPIVFCLLTHHMHFPACHSPLTTSVTYVAVHPLPFFSDASILFPSAIPTDTAWLVWRTCNAIETMAMRCHIGCGQWQLLFLLSTLL